MRWHRCRKPQKAAAAVGRTKHSAGEVHVDELHAGFKLAAGIAGELGAPYSFEADEEQKAKETITNGNRQNRQRLDTHGTIVVGSCETFRHYNVQGVK